MKHIESLESQNEESISEISELREECEAFKNDYKTTTKKLDAAEEKMKILTQNVGSSQQHIAELQKRVTELNTSCSDSEKVLFRVCENNASAFQLVQEMMNEREKLEKQMELFEQDVRSLTETNKELQTDKESITNSLEQHIEQIAASQKEAGMWAESLVAKDDEISELKETLQKSTHEMAKERVLEL